MSVLEPTRIYCLKFECGRRDYQPIIDIAVDCEGSIYCLSSNMIIKRDSRGKVVTKWGYFGDGEGEFGFVSGDRKSVV